MRRVVFCFDGGSFVLLFESDTLLVVIFMSWIQVLPIANFLSSSGGAMPNPVNFVALLVLFLSVTGSFSY